MRITAVLGEIQLIIIQVIGNDSLETLKQIMKKNCNHENAKWAQLLTIDPNNKYITSLAPSMSRQWTGEKDLYSSVETIIQSRTIEVIG